MSNYRNWAEQHNRTRQNNAIKRKNKTQHNTTQHNTTQHNTTQHNTTQHNTTQHNKKENNTTLFIKLCVTDLHVMCYVCSNGPIAL